MNPIKCYPLKPYIEAELWKPQSERTGKGTQREYAKYVGVHYTSVYRWCSEGWIIDENGTRYNPQRTTK